MRERLPAVLLAALLCAGEGRAQGEGSAPEDFPAATVAAEPSLPEVEEQAAPVGYQSIQRRSIVLSEGELRASVDGTALRPERGYTPLEVTLHNAGSVPRAAHLSFRGHERGGRAFSRTVEVGPRQRLITHLLVPAQVQAGSLHLVSPGLVSQPAAIYLGAHEGAAVLVLGTDESFEAGTALREVEEKPKLSVRFLAAREAPRELAAYVGYRVVVLGEEAADVPAEVWLALEAYAATGGSLVLLRPPRDLGPYLPLLTATPPDRHPYGFGRVRLCAALEPCGAGLLEDTAKPMNAVQPAGPPPRWTHDRHGLGGGMRPLLPNAQAPVGRFLLLITLFTLVVGPGGLLLARRRGPVALLIAVPSVALATCVAIVVWSILVDGFSTHAARYSLTWLDRARARAVTIGFGSYYANLSPEGVRMPVMSALLGPEHADEQVAEVDWSNGMAVGAGFLPTRSYREWGEVAVTPSRARLVARREGEGVRVQNALGAPLVEGQLQLGGRRWTLPAMAEGAEALATALPLDGQEPLEVLAEFSPEVKRRFADGLQCGLCAPLPEGEFVVRLGGAGPVPTAELPVELREGVHFVRGQVDAP